MENQDTSPVENPSGILTRLLSVFKKIHAFIGPKLLFTLAIGGIAAGSFTFLNILADMNPAGKLASLRASAGLPVFDIQSRHAETLRRQYQDCPSGVATSIQDAWIGCYYKYSPHRRLSIRGQVNYFDPAALVLVRSDREIAFDWSKGASASPGVGVPEDYFSVRWLKTVTTSGNPLQFKIRADDGIRIYIDRELVFDKWLVQEAGEYQFTYKPGAGVHNIMIEYFEATGLAAAHVHISEAP